MDGFLPGPTSRSSFDIHQEKLLLLCQIDKKTNAIYSELLKGTPNFSKLVGRGLFFMSSGATRKVKDYESTFKQLLSELYNAEKRHSKTAEGRGGAGMNFEAELSLLEKKEKDEQDEFFRQVVDKAIASRLNKFTFLAERMERSEITKFQGTMHKRKVVAKFVERAAGAVQPLRDFEKSLKDLRAEYRSKPAVHGQRALTVMRRHTRGLDNTKIPPEVVKHFSAVLYDFLVGMVAYGVYAEHPRGVELGATIVMILLDLGYPDAYSSGFVRMIYDHFLSDVFFEVVDMFHQRGREHLASLAETVLQAIKRRLSYYKNYTNKIIQQQMSLEDLGTFVERINKQCEIISGFEQLQLHKLVKDEVSMAGIMRQNVESDLILLINGYTGDLQSFVEYEPALGDDPVFVFYSYLGAILTAYNRDQSNIWDIVIESECFPFVPAVRVEDMRVRDIPRNISWLLNNREIPAYILKGYVSLISALLKDNIDNPEINIESTRMIVASVGSMLEPGDIKDFWESCLIS